MNIKKLDEKEVIFMDEQWSENERKQFSELLRKKKEKNFAKNKAAGTKLNIRTTSAMPRL